MTRVPDLGALSPRVDAAAGLADPSVMHPGYVPGLWYGNPQISNPIITAAPAADTLYAQPTPIYMPVRLSQLGMVVGTQAIGSHNAKMALYANGPNGRPGRLIAPCVGVADMTVAANSSRSLPFATPQQVQAGIYWLVALFDTGGSMPYTIQSNVVVASGFAVHSGSQTAAGLARGGTSPTSRITAPRSYADGFPAQFGESVIGTGAPGCPVIAFEVAS